MYAIFETNTDDIKSKGNDSIIKIDSNIQSLSWMSKLNLLNNNSECTNEKQFQQEGWLATGNSNFMVGCTFTSCLTSNKLDSFQNVTNLNRTNFNLRGHKSEIKLVRWNEAYQKLASCDSKGVIYVWVKYEGRWSIELINDRGNQVTDFAWSHDGRQAVICYQDGFVLVGSVNGQRYWSNLYDLSNAVINTATWTPNDAFILLGLSNGSLILIDENGVIVNRYSIVDDSIIHIAYNCPKFFLNELHEMNKTSSNHTDQQNQRHTTLNRQRLSSINFSSSSQNQSIPNIRLKNKINNSNYLIAVLFKSNQIYILKSYDMYFDPVVINTRLDGVKFEWSSCGKILCVGGHVKETERKRESKKVRNYIKFYSLTGTLIYEIEIPSTKGTGNKNSLIDKLELKQKKITEQYDGLNKDLKCLNALTWAHNDQRLFVSCSNQLHILKVFKHIPSLMVLTQHRIKSFISEPSQVKQFQLPAQMKNQLTNMFKSSIKMSYPKQNQLRKFVCSCLPNNERLHCTLKRMNIKSNHDYFILYLEYLGGLVPLLSAKKVSKLKPDFVIFDPYLTLRKNKSNQHVKDSNLTKKIPISKTFTETIEKIDYIDDEIRKRIETDDTTSLTRSISSLISFSSSGLSSTSSMDNLSNSSSIDSLLLIDDAQTKNKKLKKKFLKTQTKQNQTKKIKIQKIQKRYRFNTNRFSHKVKDNSLDMNSRHKFDSLVTKKNKKKTSNKNNFKNNFLVQVCSNFWGTKFKFYGHKYLPQEIGQIVYKTSLFHLQPRQMTITLEDLTDDSAKKFDCNNYVSSISGLIPIAPKISKSLSSSCASLDTLSPLNLPVLQLASPSSTQIYNDSEEINCLITSEIVQERGEKELLLDKKSPKRLSSELINFFRNNLRSSKQLENIQEVEKKEDCKPRQFTLHNKPPIWNETSQVYQLDFGGRVTQESAKNFQVEYQGKQVMQFGRIDTNAYTLDFEWPFTTVQAFSIALANITQRLK